MVIRRGNQMMKCSKCNKNIEDCKCIPDWFKDKVKEKVEFYKKYRSHWTKFEKDFPNGYKEFEKIPVCGYFERDYNWWLFDYCFKENIE